MSARGWKKDYPPSEGWIRAELTMKSRKMIGEQAAKELATWGQAKDYEFGTIEQHGARVVVIMREFPEAKAKRLAAAESEVAK